MEGYVQGALRKQLHMAPSVERLKTTTFWKSWKSLPKHCIFADSLLIVSYIQGVLRKELLIAPFVEHFRIASLGKSH